MFEFLEKKYKNFDLKILKSDIFSESIEHFFTSRVGGDTPKPLNDFTLSAKDFPEYKDFEVKNQKIACDILGGKYENLLMPNQQHTDKIAVIKSVDDMVQLKSEPFDAVVTNLKGFPVCMVFADCVPILLFDEEKSVLACVHAGWKGTAKEIVKKAVKIMQNEFSCGINKIKCAIGPSIGHECFEVSREVADQLAMTVKNNCDKIFTYNNDKCHVDLKKLNKEQLEEAGVFSVDVCNYCTSCRNDLFYSYRADSRCTGRHGMLAMIKE